jgi:hypothetical protein
MAQGNPVEELSHLFAYQEVAGDERDASTPSVAAKAPRRRRIAAGPHASCCATKLNVATTSRKVAAPDVQPRPIASISLKAPVAGPKPRALVVAD